MAIASLTLGITGLFTWVFPITGFPISLAGTIVGAMGFWQDKERKKIATAGLITGVIGIVINIAVIVVGVFMFGILEAIGQMLLEYPW